MKIQVIAIIFEAINQLNMTELELDNLEVLRLIEKKKNSKAIYKTEDIEGYPLTGTIAEILRDNSDSLSMDFSRLQASILYLQKNLHITNTQNQTHSNYFRVTSDYGVEYLKKLEALKKEFDVEKQSQKEHVHNERKFLRWQVKSFWWIFGVAVFGGLYSVFDFIVHVTSKNIPQDQIVTKDMLENNQAIDYSDSLKTKLK